MHLNSKLPPHIFVNPLCLTVTLHKWLTGARKGIFLKGMALVFSDNHLLCEFNASQTCVLIWHTQANIAGRDRIQVAQWLSQQEEVVSVIIAHGKTAKPGTLELTLL